MSQVTLCDICNKPISDNQTSTSSHEEYHLKINKVSETFTFSGYLRNNEKLDVCPKCMQKIIQYVKEGN